MPRDIEGKKYAEHPKPARLGGRGGGGRSQYFDPEVVVMELVSYLNWHQKFKDLA